MDQLNTHAPASLYEAFPPDEAKRLAEKLEIHHTPKHGSWLNMAEIELSALARDLPERVGDKAALERHVAAWEQRRNAAEVKANWQFTTADARIKLRKLYPTMDADGVLGRAEGETEAVQALPTENPYALDDLLTDDWFPASRCGIVDPIRPGP